MKILLTGASSFTGFHFAGTLHESGHQVIAPMRGKAVQTGAALRDFRLSRLHKFAQPVYGCAFGSDAFLALLEKEKPDILCHHAALVGDYHNPDYDLLAAVKANTFRLRDVLAALNDHAAFIATGSVFENDEGAGNAPLRAFSPYGLSKALSWQIEKYYCQERGIPFGKFVIPNPFGPFEEPRFCNYLIKCWKAGETAEVRTPSYMRDNIHVSLLATIYVDFALSVFNKKSMDAHCNPSGYVETQGAFTLRFAEEMRKRSQLACAVTLAEQKEFAEPVMRINTDFIRPDSWNEKAAWDSIADYYQI